MSSNTAKVPQENSDIVAVIQTNNVIHLSFGSNEFVTKIRQLKHHALVGVCSIRKLADGRSIAQLHKRGQQV